MALCGVWQKVHWPVGGSPLPEKSWAVPAMPAPGLLSAPASAGHEHERREQESQPEDASSLHHLTPSTSGCACPVRAIGCAKLSAAVVLTSR